MEKIFPKADNNKDTIIILLEIVLQTSFIAVYVFYLQKIVKLVPFIFMGSRSYRPYKVFEYSGEITISLILINTQQNLINKIQIINDRLLNYLKI